MSGQVFSDSEFDSAPPQASGGSSNVVPDSVFDAPPATQGDGAPDGSAPHLALNSSPLSIIERAAFGWAKKPEDQMTYLAKEFGGKNNVQIVPGQDGKGSFVVKAKDGKWRSVDPTGWSDFIGDTAQMLGEKPLQTLGAGLGGAAAIAAAPAGIILGGLALAAGGAGGAALGANGEMGLRMLGGEHYSLKEWTSQMAASMVFGAEQEIGGKILGAGMKAVPGVLGAALSKMMPGTEAGQLMRARITSAIGGLKPALARAWANDPLATSTFQKIAMEDEKAMTNTLQDSMKGEVEGFFKKAQGALRSIGQKYDKFRDAASGKEFDIIDPEKGNTLGDAFSQLQKERYLDASGEISTKTVEGWSREVRGQNRAALQTAKDLFDQLKIKVNKGAKIGYSEIEDGIRNLDNHLFGENGQATFSDANLGRVLKGVRAEAENVLERGLNKIDPALALEKASIDETYGPVKDLVEHLGNKAEGQRLDTFLKQIVKDDGSFNSGLMKSITALTGEANPTEKLLQMEAARQTTHIFKFGGGRVLGTRIPQLPRLAAGLLKAEGLARKEMQLVGAPIMQGAKDLADSQLGQKAAPMMKSVVQSFKGMSADARKAFMNHPDAIQGITDVLTSAMFQEEQDKNSLLQQGGFTGGQQ